MDTREFISKVKNSITFPTYQARYQDSDILSFANEEQELEIASVLTSLREEFFVYKHQVTIAGNTEKIDIPARAIGRVIRMIEVYQGTSTPEILIRVPFDDKNEFQGSVNGNPFAVYVQDDSLYFLPTPSEELNVNLYFEMSPGDLVATTETATITNVGIDTVTVSRVPSNLTVGTLVDVTKNVSGFRPKIIDAEITDIASTVITLAGFGADNPLSDLISVGYSVSEATKTSIVQLPREATTLLIKYTARRMLQGQNLPDHIKTLDDAIAKAERRLREVCSPRIINQNPSVINRNGLLRGRGYGNYRNRKMNL